MNTVVTTHCRKRKYGFSGQRQLETVSPKFLALVVIGVIISIAPWCALSDDSSPTSDPTPAASTSLEK
jgi:hypothetical protein